MHIDSRWHVVVFITPITCAITCLSLFAFRFPCPFRLPVSFHLSFYGYISVCFCIFIFVSLAVIGSVCCGEADAGCVASPRALACAVMGLRLGSIVASEVLFGLGFEIGPGVSASRRRVRHHPPRHRGAAPSLLAARAAVLRDPNLRRCSGGARNPAVWGKKVIWAGSIRIRPISKTLAQLEMTKIKTNETEQVVRIEKMGVCPNLPGLLDEFLWTGPKKKKHNKQTGIKWCKKKKTGDC